jgi:SAM-dependent methyltransferase
MRIASDDVAFPPLELASRVGSLADSANPYATYDDLGRRTKASLLELLPHDWSFVGKRILDFGCGAGRTLRHFVEEATVSEFWGCDIDAKSVEWVQTELSPPFKVFTSPELPPLPFEDDTFDLVYAVSVFSHLADSWSAWLLELRRVLCPEGVFVATFIGPDAAPWITDEEWSEDRIGMNVLRPGQTWDLGGPMVLHSPWWIRAHWGRAFEPLMIEPGGFASKPGSGQGIFVGRKRQTGLSDEELRRPEVDEPRETAALSHNVEQLSAELIALQASIGDLAVARDAEHAARVAAERRAAELRDAVLRLEDSRSWRLTKPLRTAGAAVRRVAGRERRP